MNMDLVREIDTYALMRNVCERPCLYLVNDSFGEFLSFVQGIAVAVNPPHGCLRMDEFIAAKYEVDGDAPWPKVVTNLVSDLNFRDSCSLLGQLIGDFRGMAHYRQQIEGDARLSLNTNPKWGTCTRYFETDNSNHSVVRRVDSYATGPKLGYGPEHRSDELGKLTSSDMKNLEQCCEAISFEQFYCEWTAVTNRK